MAKEFDQSKTLDKIFGPSKGSLYRTTLQALIPIDGETFVNTMLHDVINKPPHIDFEVVKELKKRADESQKQPSKEIREAKTALVDFMSQPWVQQITRNLSAIPIIYGSIQYGDPQNLDADIVLATNTNQQESSRMAIIRLHISLINKWFQTGIYTEKKGNEPHISLVTVNQNLLTLMRENPEQYESQLIDLSVIISGAPLFDKDEQKHAQLKQQTIASLQHDPLGIAFVNHYLRECLQIRMQRQKKQ